MSLRVVFLGTSGAVPTQKRSLPAVLVQRKGEQIMFDCGEGAQRQMIKAKCGLHGKMKIFITHMHGDHVLGLPGLLQTMALLDRRERIRIYGPRHLREFLECVKETTQFALTFEVEIAEIDKTGMICDEEEYEIYATRTNHVVQSFAYAIVEKPRCGRFHPNEAKALGIPEGPLWSELQQGHTIRLPNGKTIKPQDVLGKPRTARKIVYTGDTRPFSNAAKFAQGADLLIHDATLAEDLADRANADGHSTPAQAASAAKKAKVKQLVLTHISARYNDTKPLLEQAKKIFKKTLVAEDLLTMEIAMPRA